MSISLSQPLGQLETTTKKEKKKREDPMGKDHWNRKRVYSIRKFSIGVCSIVIGTCFLLFGASVAGASPVYAEETTALVAAEKPTEEKPIEEEVTAEAVTHQAAEPVVHSQEEKKEESPQLAKAAEDISAATQNETKENGQEATQGKAAQPEIKSATKEEVSQMIEDRKVNFNQNWHFKLNANAKEAVQAETDVTSWSKSKWILQS